MNKEQYLKDVAFLMGKIEGLNISLEKKQKQMKNMVLKKDYILNCLKFQIEYKKKLKLIEPKSKLLKRLNYKEINKYKKEIIFQLEKEYHIRFDLAFAKNITIKKLDALNRAIFFLNDEISLSNKELQKTLSLYQKIQKYNKLLIDPAEAEIGLLDQSIIIKNTDQNIAAYTENMDYICSIPQSFSIYCGEAQNMPINDNAKLRILRPHNQWNKQSDVEYLLADNKLHIASDQMIILKKDENDLLAAYLADDNQKICTIPENTDIQIEQVSYKLKK